MPAPYRSGAVNPPPRETVYSDLTTTFTPHPLTGRPTVLRNEDAVNQAVRNVVLTNRYERLYEPNLNDTVRERLFELFDDPGVTELRRVIATALENHETRTTLLDVEIIERRDENELFVRIVHEPRNGNGPQTVDVLLDRIR